LKFTGFEQKLAQGLLPQVPLFGCVQTPPLHTSLVQLFPSSVHALVLLVCVHVPALQTSVVHTLLSLQFRAVCWQPVAGLQESVVHASLSSQLTCVWRQPCVASQLSDVHALLSSQFRGAPAWQPLVALHTSAPLQACPSLQSASVGVKVQASFASLQLSVVQLTSSLHTTAVPG
jgi:hypothetical protein